MKYTTLFLSLIFSLFSTLNFGYAQSDTSGARIEKFSPQGAVKNVRQVTARFSEQMVPYGEPRIVEPFDIKCPEKGRAR